MTDEATRAERKLAALILTKLDVDIDPAKLREFIKSEWRTIAPLAHIVHSAPDYTKPLYDMPDPSGATMT
jgi:hypothetical protein